METTGKIYVQVLAASSGRIESASAIKELLTLCDSMLQTLLNEGEPKPAYNIMSPPLRIEVVVGESACHRLSNYLKALDGEPFRTSRHANGALGNALSRLQRFAVTRDVMLEVSSNASSAKATLSRVYTSGNRKQWVDAEIYLRGILTSAGGRSHPFVKLDTGMPRQLRIEATQKQIAGVKQNPIYKECTVRTHAKMNAYTNSVDSDSLEAVELIDFSKEIDTEALEKAIELATQHFADNEPLTELISLRKGKYGI